MRKARNQLFLILLLLLISACTRRNSSESTGTITEIRENTVTILTDDYKKENGNQEVGDLSFTWDQTRNLKVGEKIKFYSEGPAATTFPATVTVTEVEKLAK
ncbi:hypothetical protein P7G51_02165 [Enterococcus asini]|uniref:hypothetical protein n=1 Tax=Enterococcus TaxID=1350 RepID=UPI00288F78C8|nr:hypothetical protein [Enterococcus asini]MDT2756192.1 hypothetical protein [Enterococcus asini]